LADVLHALKKYPVRAIEDAITYTQKQTWSKAKAGVFVNYIKKWTPTTNAVKSKPTAAPEPVKTALMKRFPDIATTLSQEQNPIDEATLDYLQRLKVAGGIYDMLYSSIHPRKQKGDRKFSNRLIEILNLIYFVYTADESAAYACDCQHSSLYTLLSSLSKPLALLFPLITERLTAQKPEREVHLPPRSPL
jgi:hypothetical protein